MYSIGSCRLHMSSLSGQSNRKVYFIRRKTRKLTAYSVPFCLYANILIWFTAAKAVPNNGHFHGEQNNSDTSF